MGGPWAVGHGPCLWLDISKTYSGHTLDFHVKYLSKSRILRYTDIVGEIRYLDNRWTNLRFMRI